MTSEGHSERPLISVQTAGVGVGAISSGTRMLRSPSRESVTTDLSLFSISTIGSDPTKMTSLRVSFKAYSEAQLNRGPSPNPDSSRNRLTVPGDNCGSGSPSIGGGPGPPGGGLPGTIPEIWFEEETDLIRSCGALSSALGLQKSFSTSDISQLPSADANMLKPSVSEMAVWGSRVELAHPRLEHASRSCSLWVAVGDIASTSQLPSPQGRPTGHSVVTDGPAFTAADLIRSVNKKVRQNYIRRRLLTTYRALERLSQSEFNLDRLELPASVSAGLMAAEDGTGGASTAASAASAGGEGGGTVTENSKDGMTDTGQLSSELARAAKGAGAAGLGIRAAPGSKGMPLTLRDVERDRGKPLSKYERNMMIFNWLHSLDDTSFEGLQ